MKKELARVNHDPLFLVSFEPRKAYDTVDRGLFIWTLEGYGARPFLYELLVTF